MFKRQFLNDELIGQTYLDLNKFINFHSHDCMFYYIN